MNDAAKSSFVYVTYIRTTPEKLWTALTDPEFMKRYWFGVRQESDWKPGSGWRMISGDGTVTDMGEIIEIDPPKHLAIKWQNEFRPELKAEGYSRCNIDLEPTRGAVKLTIVHTIDRADSKLIEAVSDGWPRVTANLKSILETGEVALETMRI